MSRSQPHSSVAPPAESLAHISSSSFCVSQFTISEIAWLNLNFGPAFSARNSRPSSSKCTVITEPFRPGPVSPYSTVCLIFELRKTET